MLRSHLFPVLGLLAAALPAADAPTDQELFASYCVGVLTVERNLSVSSGEATAPGPVGDALRKLGKERDERMTRLNDYLIAKNVYRSPDTETGILLANRNGQRDIQQCPAQASVESHQCVSKCISTATASEVEQCVDKCPQPDSCRRVRRCTTDINQLPF